MNPEFTAEQKEQLKTWAEQRDSLSSEILILRTESEKLQTLNKELAYSISDLETRISEIRGRIKELAIKENELLLTIPRDIALLRSTKATLESEINNLSKIVELLTSQKASLEGDVSFVLKTFNTVKGETLLLDKVVDRVTSVSHDNAVMIDSIINKVAKSLEEIVEVNKKNVFETNVVIEKLPAMIMEAQKHGLIKNKI